VGKFATLVKRQKAKVFRLQGVLPPRPPDHGSALDLAGGSAPILPLSACATSLHGAVTPPQILWAVGQNRHWQSPILVPHFYLRIAYFIPAGVWLVK